MWLLERLLLLGSQQLVGLLDLLSKRSFAGDHLRDLLESLVNENPSDTTGNLLVVAQVQHSHVDLLTDLLLDVVLVVSQLRQLLHAQAIELRLWWWRRLIYRLGRSLVMVTMMRLLVPRVSLVATSRHVSITASVVAATASAASVRVSSVVAMASATAVVATSGLHGWSSRHDVLHEVGVGLHHAKQTVNLVLHRGLINLLGSQVPHLFGLEVLHIH